METVLSEVMDAEDARIASITNYCVREYMYLHKQIRGIPDICLRSCINKVLDCSLEDSLDELHPVDNTLFAKIVSNRLAKKRYNGDLLEWFRDRGYYPKEF